MFNLFKPKPNPSSRAESRDLTPSNTESLTLKLSGLHCTSCAVDIDLTLEDLPGVKASTNYAKSETKIEYDPKKTTLDLIRLTIRDLGYTIK